MAIQKPHTRLVNIRLSEEELASLQRATTESNARSISDYCRTAILSSRGKEELHDIERRLARLEAMMTQQADRLAPAPLIAQHV